MPALRNSSKACGSAGEGSPPAKAASSVRIAPARSQTPPEAAGFLQVGTSVSKLQYIGFAQASISSHMPPSVVTSAVHVPGPVDLVLHFASPASPIDYLKMPIETLKVGSLGTLHTLGLAHEKGARYVLA